MATLKISRNDFWYSTPWEIYKMYETYFKDKEYSNRDILETIRLQTFYTAYLPKGTTFSSFCRDSMSFPWDKPQKSIKTKGLTFEDSEKIRNRWKKLKDKTIDTKKLNSSEVKIFARD